MKPTGATKEATASEQAKEIVRDCVNWSDIQYRILPRVEALINERERLRETVITVVERFQREYHDLTDGQYGSVEDFNEVKELRAALNDATTSTSAGGG